MTAIRNIEYNNIEISQYSQRRIIKLWLAYQRSVFDFALTDIGFHTDRLRLTLDVTLSEVEMWQ
jgi:hypothetical protein